MGVAMSGCRRGLLVVAVLVQLGLCHGGKTLFDLPKYKGMVETREEGDLPAPLEFYTKYATGFGKPFIMKGAAKKMTAFTKWRLDADIARHFPNAYFDQIEFAKKETRVADANRWPVSKFLREYNHTDCYVVSKLHKGMA